MKLQFDTIAKTIKVEESVRLSELVEALEKLLPNGEWKEYQLQTNTVINWNTAPIVIEKHIWPQLQPYRPFQPYYGQGGLEITCNTKTLADTKGEGLLNYQIN